MKLFFRFLTGFFFLFILYVLIVLIHGTITDFQPEQEIELSIAAKNQSGLDRDSLSLLIWNLGYAGLGKESSFFYDEGGMLFAGNGMVRPPQNLVAKNQTGILRVLQSEPADLYLLQEVDVNSKRSYYMNQYLQIDSLFESFNSTLGVNYYSPRVPIPILEPWRAYGKVESGLATFSRFAIEKAIRYQLPGEYPWPTKIFQLDRCVTEHRLSLSGGKSLVFYNIHNSAYDKGGKLKAQQMQFLKELFLKEFNAGNYVIAGGDWNQCPPYWPFDRFMPGRGQGYSQINIDPEFLPQEWTWAYDARTPTNRKVAAPFEKGKTFVTIIDFFLVSPNVKVKKVEALNLDFDFSDHQPLRMEVELVR